MDMLQATQAALKMPGWSTLQRTLLVMAFVPGLDLQRTLEWIKFWENAA